ncbi:MAG: hypothetical protein MK085_05170 [Phycisphaerales bacterium]|nr:hypothetical protein [Phycisphaerales bacterium]
MSTTTHREARLAAYGVLAGLVGGHAAADIQMYEGDPIPIDGSPINLALGNLDFNMAGVHNSWGSGNWNTMYTCCEFYYGSWSTFCVDKRQTGSTSQWTTFNLEVSCQTNMRSAGFGDEGDPVNGANGCNTTQFICSSWWSHWESCDSSNSSSGGSCGEARRFYVGFSADTNDGDTVFGWMQIDGSGTDLEITKWAYEDSGAPIAIGDEPPPPKCNADINGDGKVDAADLGMLLGAWGDCPE